MTRAGGVSGLLAYLAVASLSFLKLCLLFSVKKEFPFNSCHLMLCIRF
jgi:hypothetical protein